VTGRHGPSAAAGWWRRRHCGELLALEGSRRMKWARHETACQAGLGQGVDVLVAGRPQVGGLLRGDHDGARAEELRVRALIPLLSAPRAGPVSGSLARVFKGEGRRPIDEVEGEQGQQQQTRDAQESYPRRSSVRVSVGGHPRQSRRRAPVYIARWRKAEVAEPALPRPSPTRGDSIHWRESWRKRVGIESTDYVDGVPRGTTLEALSSLPVYSRDAVPRRNPDPARGRRTNSATITHRRLQPLWLDSTEELSGEPGAVQTVF